MSSASVNLGNDVHVIDTMMSGYSGITAGYVVVGERPCLIETGTARSAPVVTAALRELGIGPEDLATVVVTHIHLDHAGGVGDIAAAYPQAQVVVHQAGARHLVDPSRLMGSARRVYGAAMDDVFGELIPTPTDRVRAVDGNAADGADVIDLGGGRTLTAHYSPGHAKHHIGLLDSATGDLYVGDAVGIYIPEADVLKPSTPPPDFDLETAVDSLHLFGELSPTRLLFSHYGPVSAVAETLARSEDELRTWVGLTRLARSDRLDLDHAVAMVHERTAERYAAVSARPDVAEKFEQLNSVAANLVGINRWLDRVDGTSYEMGDASTVADPPRALN